MRNTSRSAITRAFGREQERVRPAAGRDRLDVVRDHALQVGDRVGPAGPHERPIKHRRHARSVATRQVESTRALAASPTDVVLRPAAGAGRHRLAVGGTEQEAVAEQIAAWLAPTGCTQTWVDEPDNPARSLVVTLPGDGGPAVALLGHPDTVFPAGTTARWRFARDGDRCTGPGVADMKGGLVLAAMAMERLAALPRRGRSRELRLLICADEEVRLRAPAACRSRPRRRRRARVRVRRAGTATWSRPARARSGARCTLTGRARPRRRRHRPRPQRRLGARARGAAHRGPGRRAGRR